MSNTPFVSIVIPTYERPQQLALCLAALTELDYPTSRFEVIVVDDGGATSLEPVVAPFAQQCNCQLVVQANAGPATARNTGAARAQGEYLAFLDDDCALDTGWLKAMGKRLVAAPDTAVGGRTVNALGRNHYAAASQVLVDYLYAYYNANAAQARFFTSNNMALPADRFRELKGFDTGFPLAAAEDRELCDRWLWHGHRMVYAPEAIVYHAHALGLRTYLRQHHNYGRGAFHYHRVRRGRQQQAPELEPLSFYLNLLGYPFAQEPPARAFVQTVLLALAQAANALGYYRSRMGL